MAYDNFPNLQGIGVLNSNEQIEIGRFSPDTNFEIAYIKLKFMRLGTAGGTETLQCHTHTQGTDLSLKHASSNTVQLSSWTSNTGFIGWMRFDFNDEAYNANNTYHISLQTANYTRNADTFYLAVVHDGLDQVNTTTTDSPHWVTEYAYGFQLFVREYEY